MMTSILNLESAAPPEVAEREPAAETVEASEFEIVLGRAQIASWLFVVVIAVAVCSSLSYLAGETMAAKQTARIAATPPTPVVAPAATPAPAPVSIPAALPQASILVASKSELAELARPSVKPSVPLFAQPQTGKVYLQIGAVERGMAMILAEGLRSHGFDSFVAPGPNEKIFRVLIGPLPNPDAFRRAMVEVNALDLTTFARKDQR